MAVQTLPFQTLLSIDRTASTPIFQQVVDGLKDLIEKGILKPGFSLPSSRELATLLELNRTTVVAAYDELKNEGWLQSIPRKGIIVSKTLPQLKPKKFQETLNEVSSLSTHVGFFRTVSTQNFDKNPHRNFDLVINDGYPDARIAPLEKILSRYKSLLGKHYKHTHLINERPAGSSSLRNELSLFLSQTRGLNVTADDILVTKGAQGAIYIAANLIIKPGSKVIVGQLNYSMANRVFLDLGATLIKIPIDENGLDVAKIESICESEQIDLIYVVPHHHHPTTVTLSPDRRTKLLDIIKKYKIPTIEDDYDYDFHYTNSPVLPLASADHSGLILYVGSLTKTLALTLRSGYLVASSSLIWQASKLKELMEIRGDYLMDDSLAHLFKSGEMQRHIARSVKLYKQRRDVFCSLMKKDLANIVRFKVPDGGMAVWTIFEKEYSLPLISEQLLKKGIYLNDGSLYNQGDPKLNAVRIGFASMNESEMENFISSVYTAAIQISTSTKR